MESTTRQSGPAERRESRTRFGKWADRLEETADERPPAPWGSFPIGAVSVFVGLVLAVIGLINANPVQLAIGVGLGMLGGLELAIREHFTGFRSHTTLLAGFVFVVAVGATFYAAHWILWQSLLLGAALFGATFWLLRKKFEKASGGLSYKLR
ncbi:MAG TPA: hypothetical protein PKA56_01300 [Solirubrobacterales bacterium]|nr:hypothetical protein [Solirubrobacterales bacterium]HMU25947.1 hypothetical protein [Solirubrobacterales bacterium]HMW45691.1 hypothetical protein [Solirubrobacterales bacterium]HMX70372.1 hypothetical protein [Solirubrobacterales bacterium]HMY24736.1 hypothetical protein [Solirubrobacterales bacterium]